MLYTYQKITSLKQITTGVPSSHGSLYKKDIADAKKCFEPASERPGDHAVKENFKFLWNVDEPYNYYQEFQRGQPEVMSQD